MQKVKIDYIFRTSPSMLFKRLSTPSGLSEWFAEDVSVSNDVYTFKWKNYSQAAKFSADRKKFCIKFDWLDEDKEFLIFEIEQSKMSQDVTLYITDFVEDDETIDDAREFWDNLIQRFKHKIGL